MLFWLKFWNLVKITKFSWFCQIFSKLYNFI